MLKWLKDRFRMVQSTLRRPTLLVVFGLLQIAQWALLLLPPARSNASLSQVASLVPWYGWVIGWLLLLWFASIEYSVHRKEGYDKTSQAFFKAFLDSMITKGHELFGHSEEKDFYSRINAWQRMVIHGIAIGLGHEESEKFFQKTDKENPLPKTYRESQDQGSNEPLCRLLKENLEDLNVIRTNLAEAHDQEKGDLEAVKDIKLIAGPKE